MTTARLIALLLAVSTIVPAALAVDPPGATPASEPAAQQAKEDDTLPDAARKLVEAFQRDSAAIQEKSKQQIADRRRQAVAALRKLQDEYTRPGKLDQAMAIRDEIRRLNFESDVEIRPDPQDLSQFHHAVGQSFFFRVTGRTTGEVFGTNVYTEDSDLGTAAVHAGVLQDGKEGIVEVTILPGLDNYRESTRNGVTSNAYEAWPGSYTLRAAK